MKLQRKFKMMVVSALTAMTILCTSLPAMAAINISNPTNVRAGYSAYSGRVLIRVSFNAPKITGASANIIRTLLIERVVYVDGAQCSVIKDPKNPFTAVYASPIGFSFFKQGVKHTVKLQFIGSVGKKYKIASKPAIVTFK